MNRFKSLNEPGTHNYSASTLAGMNDDELVEEINRLPDWDEDLLAELIWRAFPDFDEPWETGDPICYLAAEKLGREI